METRLENLAPVRIVEPRVNINNERKIGVLSGPREVTYFRDISTSYSSSSVNHSITPPSNAIMDTRMLLYWQLQVSFTGPAGTGNLIQLGSNDGPRSYPLSQIITNTNLTINGQSMSFSNYDLMSALAHYIGDKDMRKSLSGTATMLDQYQSYSDWVALGSNKNPLAFYGENAYEDPRGALNISVVSNTSTSAVLLINVIEPVFVSPLTWGSMVGPGLAGVQTLQLQMQLGDLTRVWSHASSGNTISTISVVFSQAPELHYCMLSPNPDVDPYQLNRRYEYSYFNILSNSFNVGSLASGSSVSASSGTITVSSIPSRFYIFVRQQNSDRTYLTSDTFARIDSISIVWDNRSGLLASASSEQLHRMSVQNGLNQSWPQWNNYQGSVLCIQMGQDIGLKEDQAVGMMGQFQFQCQITFKKLSASSVNYQI